jgi:hypothetical protein
LNVTVPVGVPVVAELTVAVRVTDCPKTEGFDEEPRAVEVEAGTPVPVTFTSAAKG